MSQQPNRRLLRELQFCSEELQIIQDVAGWQISTLNTFSEQLNPTRCKVTTEARVTSFGHEKTHIYGTSNLIQADSERVRLLLLKLGALTRQTQSGVEVRQENHGKAIMAFTIVTVVYLPLSFVTSFFGMNTADVRDTTSTQIVYWAVSLPLTLLTIGVALLIGFKAERVQESLGEMFGKQHHANSAIAQQGSMQTLPERSTGRAIKGVVSKTQNILRFRRKTATSDSTTPDGTSAIPV